MSEKQPTEIQNKRIEYDNIIYCINEEENEASVIGCNKNQGKITIPQLINIGSKEYQITSINDNTFKNSNLTIIEISSESNLKTIGKYAFSSSTINRITIPSSVTSIGEGAFSYCSQFKEILIPSNSKLETIEKNAFFFSKIKRIIIPSSVTSIGEGAFNLCGQLEEVIIPSDSKLQTIEKFAFSSSSIKSITIPSELIELKEGWCSDTSKLTKITVSPKNPRYCFFDEKMIIGKTNVKQDNYDFLIFCVRDIKHIQIPNFIKHICSYSFAHCEQLEEVIIPSDSKLQTIEKFAFSSSTIKSITIPSELIELKEGWCSDTLELTKITVSPKNPRYFCYEEKMIISKTNIKQDNYDCLIFCVRDIKHIQIPNFIKHICSYSFSDCAQLDEIHIPSDSKLETIEKNAFSFSTIKSITIPSSVTSIGEGAFSYCSQFKEIHIPSDSKLETIEKFAFSFSKIKSITIPSELIELKEGWCLNTTQLTKITVNPKNPRYFCYEGKMIIGKTNIKQDNYDCLIFCVRNIKHIQIPNFIKHICSCSFDCCNQLDEIHIPSDSKLETIEKNAFSFSAIKSITIPSSVTSIGEGAFSNCIMLQIIEINNREMISIYQESFKLCPKTLFMIPVE